VFNKKTLCIQKEYATIGVCPSWNCLQMTKIQKTTTTTVISINITDNLKAASIQISTQSSTTIPSHYSKKKHNERYSKLASLKALEKTITRMQMQACKKAIAITSANSNNATRTATVAIKTAAI
jgi:hypothetical protein